MKITICGSMKFADQMVELQKQLENNGHAVFMPIKEAGLDYWSTERSAHIDIKKVNNLIGKHMDKIEQSDAILVANYTKGDIANYIGANTFIEMGFAQYRGKQIFVLHPLPDQEYIKDELLSFDAIILDSDVGKIV